MTPARLLSFLLFLGTAFVVGLYALGQYRLSSFTSTEPSSLEPNSHIATDATQSQSKPAGWPIDQNSAISSHYGNRRDPFTKYMQFHSGVDLSAPQGTLVRATAGGRVKRTGLDWEGKGLFIEIDHGNQYSTLYAHLKQLNFIEGESIAPGQILGEVGSSGRTTGPHLHYEVRHQNKPIDPTPYLARNEPRLERQPESSIKKILVIRNDGYYYKEVDPLPINR